jgi:hypothetical protein
MGPPRLGQIFGALMGGGLEGNQFSHMYEAAKFPRIPRIRVCCRGTEGVQNELKSVP